MRKTMKKLTQGATRLLVLALTLLAAGSVLAYASAGDLFEWNNLSASGTHNHSNTSSKWTITLNATENVPNGSVVSVTNISICSRNTYTGTVLQDSDPRYLKIGDVFSQVVNGNETVSGETLTAGTSSYPKLSFDFSDGVALTVGETYDMYLYNTGKASAAASLGAKLVQSNDSKSSLVMTAQGGGYYPLAKITGSVVSTTPVYEASPSGTSVSFSDLSWTLNGSSVELPDDLSSSVISVTLDDGAVLSLDAGIAALSFNVSGTSATLDYDTTKSFSVSAWDFSGLTGVITLRDFPDVLSDAKVTLAAGGVRLEGSESLSYLPYMDSAQTKHVDIAQPVSITSGDGAYFKFVKSDYHFSGTGESTFVRFAMGNKNAGSDNSDQTITQDSGTITVTGSNPPSSSSTASILLAHWGSTCVLNTLGGIFNATNAAVRLGWDGSATWNIGGGSNAATVNTSGISNGENGHSGAGTLNIKDNGTLNLGAYGVKMPGTVGTINLGGGTIKATADTSIANGKAAGTILNSGKVTTFNTQGHTMTLSAQLSGAGQLTKAGAGDLIITGAGTATGKTVINGGKVILSGNEAKVGTGTFELKGGNLEIAPGANNTITLAPQFVVNSSNAYQSDGSGPNIYVGPGTVVINATGSSGNGHFAQSIINIADGGDLQLTRGDLLGYNFTIPVNIAAGGKLTVSKRETFTRKLYLDGGSVYIVKNEADGRSLDLHGGQQTYVTADSSIDAATDSATIWIRNSNATMNVNDSATLSLNAIVAEGDSDAGAVGKGITKTGGGTLKLTKANTATGTLAVNAGTLQLDGGSWTGPVTIAEGASLDIVTDTQFSYGDTIVTLNSSSTISGSVKVNGDVVPVTVSSGVVTFTPAASVTTTSGTSYHPSIEAAFGVFGTAVASDESAVMTVLDGTDLSQYVSAFVTAGYYYDSAAGTVTKAVAKTSAKSYNSLASAIADVGSGTTIELLCASSEAIALDKAITLTETATYSGTLSGSGTLTLTALRNAAMTFGAWTGVVVLPADQSFGGTFFDDYGVSGSTVRLQGANTGWLHYGTVNATTDRGPIATTIEIPTGASLTITGFSPSWANTFNVLKGSGTFAVNLANEPDHSYSEVSAYFLLKDVSNFTGSLSATGAGIAIGASKPVYTTPGGKIMLTTSATIATGKTWTATGGIVLADAAATLTNTDGALSPAPTTTVANSYVKLTGSTYAVDTCKTVTFSGSNFSVAVTTNGQAVAVANNACTVEAGEISFTITPSSGYHVTAVSPSSGSVSGEGPYTYTVAGDTTITVTTEQDSSVEIGAATFAYGVDFTNATVTVAVTEVGAAGTSYTLTVNNKPYVATASAGVVTFNDVEVPRGQAYGTVGYNITSTASTTTGETSGSAPVADVVNASWINENSTTHGQDAAGGSWTNAGAVVYSDGKAEISDNRFVATTASTASRVVLEFDVCFSSASEETVSGDAQAAIKLGEDDNVTTFKILTAGNTWTPVSNAELPINPSETYNVVLTIDYGTSTYKVDVEGKSLTNSAGVASFSLATNKAAVQNIDFAGSGTLMSLKGSQFEGYMVKDALNNFYATIQAATQAYNSANGPYTVLHDGTPLDGWKIDGNTLIKLAKGFFFMAY